MNFDNYKNKLIYPVKVNFTVYVYYDKVNKQEVTHPIPQCNENLVLLNKIVDDGYRLAQDAFNNESAAINQQFITDLFEDCGVPDNTLTRYIYGIAYQEGHSGGFSEIANSFYDLIEIYDVAEKFFKTAKG